MPAKWMKTLRTLVIIIISLAVIVAGFWAGVVILINTELAPSPLNVLFWGIAFELMIGPFIGYSVYLYHRYMVKVTPKRPLWKEIVIITLTPLVLIGIVYLILVIKPDFGIGNSLLSAALVFIPMGIFVYVMIWRLGVMRSPVDSANRVKPFYLNQELGPALKLIASVELVLAYYVFLHPLISSLLLQQKDTTDMATKLTIVVAINLILVVIFIVRLITMLLAKRTLDQSTGYAQAKILDKQTRPRVEIGDLKLGHRYLLTFEYIPTMTIGFQQTRVLNADVDKKIWARLKTSQDIRIRYATQNPRIVSIEGEY